VYFTEKQLRIMEFIQSYRAQHGISPTMEEIAVQFSVTKITIYEHLNQLEGKGAIRREKFRARSIEPLVHVGLDRGPLVMPVMGTIESGAPLRSETAGESLDLTAVFSPGKDRFVLRVHGDSLKDDQIQNGDLVIVERRVSANNGDLVVAVLPDGRATLKRFYREKKRVRLQGTNGSVNRTYASEVEIRGVVVGLMRNFSPPGGN